MDEGFAKRMPGTTEAAHTHVHGFENAHAHVALEDMPLTQGVAA